MNNPHVCPYSLLYAREGRILFHYSQKKILKLFLEEFED